MTPINKNTMIGCVWYSEQPLRIYNCLSKFAILIICSNIFQDNSIRHKNTNLCVELNTNGENIDMKDCTGIDSQIWLWMRIEEDANR